MKRKLILIFFCICALALTAGGLFIGQESFYQFRYDQSHPNYTITTAGQIDSIFSELTVVPFSKLPEDYIEKSHSGKAAYKAKLSGLTYYALERDDLFKKVVGAYRLKHFICKDWAYTKCIRSKDTYYTCLDKKVLQKFLLLLHELEAANYNIENINLRSAHRHPKRNFYIGGASQSRHIYGQAIDIAVGDINGDRKSDATDKQIVLDLLENKIIRNSGGIGLYPGTKSVHFDTRGHRARWNSYTPAIKK